ncbi:MAG: hypothetical protein JWR05_2283 [Mucilaginibacter sp.]|nr:hypothetical protein [Mucilaginibacter sp.]
MLKDDFDNWQVGMLVFLKSNHRPMTVIKFYMDDFSSRFCDRMECTWNEGTEQKTDIFNYDDIDISGVNILLQ